MGLVNFLSDCAKGKGQKKTLVFWLATPDRLAASCFGTGCLKASGTFGTLWGLPIFFAAEFTRFPLAMLLLATFLSFAICHAAGKSASEADASEIVLDEAIAFAWLLFAFDLTSPENWKEWLALFVLFRFFDIVKIWPASFFDKIKNGFGVVSDDLAAAGLAGLSFFLLSKAI